jgi:hypothetical protein
LRDLHRDLRIRGMRRVIATETADQKLIVYNCDSLTLDLLRPFSSGFAAM